MSQKKTSAKDYAMYGLFMASASMAGTSIYELGRTLYHASKSKKSKKKG